MEMILQAGGGALIFAMMVALMVIAVHNEMKG
jgi:hypothetical protein